MLDLKNLDKEEENTQNIQQPLVTRLARDTEVKDDNVLSNPIEGHKLSRVP